MLYVTKILLDNKKILAFKLNSLYVEKGFRLAGFNLKVSVKDSETNEEIVFSGNGLEFLLNSNVVYGCIVGGGSRHNEITIGVYNKYHLGLLSHLYVRGMDSVSTHLWGGRSSYFYYNLTDFDTVVDLLMSHEPFIYDSMDTMYRDGILDGVYEAEVFKIIGKNPVLNSPLVNILLYNGGSIVVNVDMNLHQIVLNDPISGVVLDFDNEFLGLFAKLKALTPKNDTRASEV